MITKADNPSSLGGDLGLFFHPGNEFLDALAVEQIRVDEVLPEVDKVTMRVDESGQECLSSEIDDFCISPCKPLGLESRTCKENLAVFDCQAFDVLRGGPSHCQDVPAYIDGTSSGRIDGGGGIRGLLRLIAGTQKTNDQGRTKNLEVDAQGQGTYSWG